MNHDSNTQESKYFSWEPKPQTVPPTWVLADFDVAFEPVSVNQKKLPAKAYKFEGKLPVIDQGQAFIGGYTDNESLAIDPGNGVIVFGDHTRSFKRVSFPFAAGADGIKVLNPRLTDSRYAYYACLSLQFPNRGYSRHYSFLAKCKLPIAPEREQERIVSKIDELFSQIEEGERALARVQQLVERYRQSVLKAAVTGELTREWREKNKHQRESGDALLKRILAARRAAWEKAEREKMQAKGITPANDNWKQKYQEPSPPDTTDLPELPEGWVWVTIAQIGNTYTGTTPPTSKPELFGGGMPFFKPTDLDQGYNTHSFRESLTEKGVEYCHQLPALSVLVTCIGATIGKTGLARVSCTTNQQINALVVDRQFFDPRFMYWSFVSSWGQQQVINNSSATTLPILNKSRFESLVFPAPPITEQIHIADEVESRIEAVVHASIEFDKQLTRSRALRNAILKSAFSGNLVPQDPNDEPASALLERIAAERAADASDPPKRRRNKEAA